MSEKIAVVGAGSWGTVISALLAKKDFPVTLWARDSELARVMQASHRNPRYLVDVLVPPNVLITDDLGGALVGAESVVFAVPSHAMRSIVQRAREHLISEVLILSLAKGIEVDSLMRMSEVIESELPEEFRKRIGVLSGPNHAEEVSRQIPSATVISALDRKVALKLQEIFMTPYFRVYTNPDIVGVELGGATKNVIAIAAGISDGLGYGDNTKASLMTRGLAEMTRLGVAIGARPLTFSGLSGVGDLIVTCTSRHSRNRAVGEKIGKGMTLEEVSRDMRMVAEGVRTSLAIRCLAEKHGVEMPITKNVTEVLYEGKDPRNCVSDLMTRGAKDEIELLQEQEWG